MLQQFLLVAGAHFLALLSPGPDFFLILRYAMARGRGPAALVSLGIGLANALFILLAMGGLMALDAEADAFIAVQWAGAAFLLFMGLQFIRQAGETRLDAATLGETAAPSSAAAGALLAGLASGLLNPKNALFYASLFAVLHARDTPAGLQGLYAAWMIAAVLGWDLLVGHLAGHPRLIRRFGHGLRHIERLAGALLILLGLGIVATRLDPGLLAFA
ncbi:MULTISPECIES: LysE family translocator [Halomonas]|uniref:Threonine transporter RhtB n=1 Tax=Halomonas halophila TaxID=29573 RepID=A0ABQ0U0X6_9GAMM|nr:MULTISPECIES: LysE family translocator [Halomonas]MDR5888651.1 LysE family translocator [Halomonas salina]WJY07832.1 LysE family translocator [Halomonas halophila]GEK71987.1 threonine transporter RhtB [Halomonas halophila]